MPRRSLLALTLFAGACYPSPGPCEEGAALEVVYESGGTPQFAGQALTNQSCGNGGFCHAEGIDPEQRFGAPVGLDFDLSLASATIDTNEAEAERLAAHQELLLGTAGNAWWQVSNGLMPPAGAAGDEYRAEVTTTFDRVADDGVTFTPLPAVDTEEGREIFRNWLACGAPVVERTVRRSDSLPNAVGFTAPRCQRGCVDATWPSIYEQIVVSRCATSRCHDADGPEANLDLQGGASADPATALSGIVGRSAEGTLCQTNSLPTVAPGDPMGSLLYRKVSAETDDDAPCGGQMPESGPLLNEQQLCAIFEWIRCGACVDPADCDATCLSEARTNCDIDPGAADLCSDTLERAACSNRLP